MACGDNHYIDSGAYSDNRSIDLDGMYIGHGWSKNVSFDEEQLFQSASISWGRFFFSKFERSDLCQTYFRLRSGLGQGSVRLKTDLKSISKLTQLRNNSDSKSDPNL